MEVSNLEPRRITTTHPISIRVEPVPIRAEQIGKSWSTGEVDIIVHSLLPDGDAGRDFRIASRFQLDNFLGCCSPWDANPNHYLLLIEDISPEMIQDLTDYLDVETDAFEHHTKGRLNGDGLRQARGVLHTAKLASTLLGRASTKKDKYSLTWWKLLTHSLEGYVSESEALAEADIDATKVVVPHFSLHLSTTRRRNEFRQKEMAQVKSSASELLRQLKKNQDEVEKRLYSAGYRHYVERTEETVYKLHCNTYRAHQVISEVNNDTWGSASEERLTYVKATRHGTAFYIFLFDKDRTLEERTQYFEATVKTATQQRKALVPTFLTSSEDKAMSTSGTIQRGCGVTFYPADVDTNTSDANLQPKFDESTKHRFLRYVSQQGLLDLPPAQSHDDLPVLRLQLAFTRMIAEDWDLVLSQMSQTLDDIDRKMSDNNQLRENVLAWRRLLGSWRVTTIEYKAKLLQTIQFLRSQIEQPVPGIRSVLSTADSNQNQRRGSDLVGTSIRSIDSELKEILSSYEILTDGIKEIESRVERSFHALMSSMSILESQNAIMQGSAVARLTELAFIFIPLNFACTFFSMQITNFQGDSQPSINSFFALALSLMLFLYGIRAFIRSRLLNNIKQILETRIRETGNRPGTSDIPTQVIVSFRWQQLGSFIRAVSIVLPIAGIVLVLIVTLSQWIAFRIAGALVTVLGTLVIICFLAIESYVPALQSIIVVAWLISILGIGLGRIEPFNTAVMATLCTIVTTLFLSLLASIPQTIVKNPVQRASEIVLLLWFVELPTAVLCHYYNISSPQWEVWVLLIGLFSVSILFGTVVWMLAIDFYKFISQRTALAAFAIGIPMTLVWSYWPQHGKTFPLYGAVVVSFASVVVFFLLLRRFKDIFAVRNVSWAHAIFFAVLCCIVVIPIMLVWETLPSSNVAVPRYAQISVTCGSVVLFATFLMFIRPFSRHFTTQALLLYWAATAAWLPALLWAGQISAFKGLTDNHTNTVHVTWTSILFWTITWGIVACINDSYKRKTNYRYRV